MWWTSNVEKKLLWKHDKNSEMWWNSIVEIDNCGNAIKLVNVVKLQFDGARQISNSVKYSESIVEFLYWKKNCG